MDVGVPTCPYCAAELPADVAVCPECGRDLRPPEPAVPAPPSGLRLAGGLGCVILAAALALIGLALLFGVIAGGLLG